VFDRDGSQQMFGGSQQRFGGDEVLMSWHHPAHCFFGTLWHQQNKEEATMTSNADTKNRRHEAGTANSNKSGCDEALKVFNQWQEDVCNNPPTDKLEDMDVKNDNMKSALLFFGGHLGSAAIQQASSSGQPVLGPIPGKSIL
jgi:hypothetical protein